MSQSTIAADAGSKVPASRQATDTQAWWKYGHVWLIISGPAVVVVAALITAWVAMSHPDPLIAEDYYRKGLEINKTLAEEQSRSLAPALQARNHAATPTVKSGSQ